MEMSAFIRTALLISAAICCISSCSRDRSTPAPPQQQAVQEDNSHKLGGNTIDISKVAGKGKIKSANTVPVYSVMDGTIIEMNLIEGQKVRKGQVLARIDDTETKLRLAELESELQRKAYDVQSALVGMEYRRDRLDEVPADVRKSAETMIGYSYTQVQIENLRKKLESHAIKAPFDGSILDLNVSRLCYARKGEPLFYLMDTDNLIVQFEVLETLIPAFTIGMSLDFTTLSFGDTKYQATLRSIAPNVESNGMVVMTAGIEGKHPELRPGMTTFVNY